MKMSIFGPPVNDSFIGRVEIIDHRFLKSTGKIEVTDMLCMRTIVRAHERQAGGQVVFLMDLSFFPLLMIDSVQNE